MTCRQVIDFLHDYLSQELPPEQREEFERHVAGCTHCAIYLESYRRTIALEQDALRDDADAADPIPDELVRAILAARRPS